MMRTRTTLNVLVGLICVGGTLLASGANRYSQKTYLAVRPQGVNTAMEYTTWNQHPYNKHGKNIRTHLQAAPFYQRSACKEGLGQYFGIGNCKSCFYVNDTTLDPATEIERGLLIHDEASYNANPHIAGLSGTVQFAPYQEVFGMRIDFFQEITHPFKNIFFRASAPIVSVSNDMKMSICNSTPANIELDCCGNNCCNPTLKEFFKGNILVDEAGSNNLQSPLTKAKIDGRRSEFGVADIDFGIGYKYIQTEKKFVFLSLDFTVPTGNKVRGNYLFEPVCGNGRHFGMGASLDAGIELWREKKADLRLLWITRYRYLFENHEDRLLGVKGIKFGQYFLAGIEGQQNKPLFPLANELVQPLDVRPGSMLDTMIDIVFNCSRFTLDLGYNLYWKDRETVHRKDQCPTKKLAVATPEYQTTAELTGDNILYSIDTKDLDVDAAKTPAQLTNKVFAGLSYSCSMYKEYLCSLGLGASYEFATTNADLENYAFWLKADFSF